MTAISFVTERMLRIAWSGLNRCISIVPQYTTSNVPSFCGETSYTLQTLYSTLLRRIERARWNRKE